MKSKTTPLALLAVACLLIGVHSQADEPAAPPDSLTPGILAPAFTLPDLDGHSHSLREFAAPHTVTVLNFWAFWCDTWKAEMPHLRALAPREKDRHFKLVAISVDGTRLSEFLQQTPQPPPFPVLLDAGGSVSRAYAVAHVPTVVVIDAQGRVRYVHSGYPGNDAVLTQVLRAQVEPTPVPPLSSAPDQPHQIPTDHHDRRRHQPRKQQS